MDQIPQDIDDKKKSEMLEVLVRSLINGYGNNVVNYFEMKKAAAYIFDHFEEIKDQNGLIYFLENLNAYWPIFKSVLTIEKSSLNKDKEQEMIKKLASYINNMPKN